MKIKVLLQVGKQSSTTHLGRGWWGAQGRAAAWWMNKADGEEREACSGREAEEVCSFYKLVSYG